jgi:hypothetical protein
MERQGRVVIMPDEREERVAAPPPEPEKVKTYSVYAACMNCNWAGDVEVPFGQPAPMLQVIADLPCENCGCVALTRLVRAQPEPIQLPPILVEPTPSVPHIPVAPMPPVRRDIPWQSPIQPHNPYHPIIPERWHYSDTPNEPGYVHPDYRWWYGVPDGHRWHDQQPTDGSGWQITSTTTDNTGISTS